ncbi:MAG: NTP transferase domain-containing protein [Boseongicola sp.]|nr:MAG: NTP transferase domain-containing protein [Boseongicola sp.]
MTAPISLMIFAAGFGKRMGVLTKDTPKPMLLLNGKPLIDHAIAFGQQVSSTPIVANTHYLHDKIAPHLAAQNIRTFHETPDILDTGGGLLAARDHLTSPTMTLNPDYAWIGPNPLQYLQNEWRDDMQALLLLIDPAKAHNREGPGDFALADGKLTRGGPMIYPGAQIIRTNRLHEIGQSKFSLNAYWDLLAESTGIHGTVYPGEWCDIGNPEGLAMAEALTGAAHV